MSIIDKIQENIHNTFYRQKIVIKKLQNSVIIDSDCNTKFVKYTEIKDGYTVVKVEDISQDICSMKYNNLFYCKNFGIFLVSNDLIERLNLTPKHICKNILFYKPFKFYLKFNGTCEKLQEKLSLIPNKYVKVLK